MFILPLLVVAALQTTPQLAAAASVLVGCVTDTANQPIPRVDIVIAGRTGHRTVEGDAAGCYEVRDLPADSYRVTARMAGFNNVTRDGVTMAPGIVARVDVVMHLSAICECIGWGGDALSTQWEHADAVLHARLAAAAPDEQARSPSYRHVASVLHALKTPRDVRHMTPPIFVLQNQSSGAETPYDIGQELVVFVTWSGAGAFEITNDNPGLTAGGRGAATAVAFLVRDGHIQRTPPGFGRYVGMPIEQFLEELRRLPGAAPPAP